MPDLDRPEHPEPTPQEAELLRHLRAIRYGQLVVHVHDARVVQIERTDRLRTDVRAPTAACG